MNSQGVNPDSLRDYVPCRMLQRWGGKKVTAETHPRSRETGPTGDRACRRRSRAYRRRVRAPPPPPSRLRGRCGGRARGSTGSPPPHSRSRGRRGGSGSPPSPSGTADSPMPSPPGPRNRGQSVADAADIVRRTVATTGARTSDARRFIPRSSGRRSASPPACDGPPQTRGGSRAACRARRRRAPRAWP